MMGVLSRGGTAQEAFAAPPAFAGLDASLLAASERAGRLEHGLAQAAQYYDTMAGARSRVLTKLAYPIFILHLAGLAFALPLLFDESAPAGALMWRLGWYLAGLWALLLGVFAIGKGIVGLARKSEVADRILRMVPVVGKLRRGFAVSRFCLAYDMQLEAGINVFSALESAAVASDSATYIASSKRAMEALKAGEPLSGALGKAGGFPGPLLRAICVGEDSGQLPTELRSSANDYRDAALKRIEIVVEWFPKVVLLCVAVYIGWQLVNYYTGMLRNLEKLGS